MGGIKKVLLLVLVLVFSFILIYKVHNSYTGLVQDPHNIPSYVNVENFNYPYPIHADEWTHLAQTIYIIESKTLGFRNPYSQELFYHKDYESGYHIFLALFFTITGVDPVLNYQYLPAIFFIINSIFLFIFVKKFTKNYYIALFSILFFLAIPSNTNFLGNWFAVPLTFSIFLMYLFFILFDIFIKDHKNKKKYLAIALIVYLISAATYPFAAILISFVLLFYLLFEVKIFRFKIIKKYKKIFLSTGTIIFLIMMFVFYSKFLPYFTFHKTWTSFQYDYSLVFFYGLIPCLFALVGLRVILSKRINKVFIIWPILCLINLLSYKLLNKGFFITYERTLFYYLLGLAPLSAIGLYFVLRIIYQFLRKNLLSFKYKKQVISLILIFLTMLCFFQIFNNYYKIEEKNLVLLYLLQKQDYNTLKFIESNYGKGNVVLADNLISIGVYSISKNHVVAMQGSNLGYGDFNLPMIFFRATCTDKLNIINENNVDFILSGFKIDCEFLKEVHKKSYVYMVEK